MTPAPATKNPGGRRIVLAALGSMGDLHPFMAIGLGLKARGHEAIVASGECYRQKIEAAGLDFRPIRPDCDRIADPVFVRRMMHPQFGLLRIGRELILPALRETYADTLAAAADADLLVSHPLAAFSSRLVAEKTGLAWVSAMLVPLGFFSAHDLPVVDVLPRASRLLRPLGPAFWGPFLRLCKRTSRFVAEPWYRLRRELGLPPTNELNPLSESHSPQLVLATFSKYFAAKQPDWPLQTVVTGFPLYDAGGELPAELDRFLDAGPPPIVFTLGTAVASDAGTFFAESAAAARRLGRRAVLVLKEPRNRPATLPDDVLACDYAPFSLLFPRAAAVVHHAGIGTTGLALHAGRAMLVMPCAWDQPDHAARIERLGVGRTITRRRYRAARVAAELSRLLDDPAYARRAAELGERVRQENGVAAACDAIERVLTCTGRR